MTMLQSPAHCAPLCEKMTTSDPILVQLYDPLDLVPIWYQIWCQPDAPLDLGQGVSL